MKEFFKRTKKGSPILWEFGGLSADKKGGIAQVVCGPKGERKIPVIMKSEKNGRHAAFVVETGDIFLYGHSYNDNLTIKIYELGEIKTSTDGKEYFELESLGELWKNEANKKYKKNKPTFSAAISALRRKLKTRNCIEAMYTKG